MPIDIPTILGQWETLGVFDFLLPALLIFAIVFGILTTTNVLGTNKGVHILISLIVAILALRAGFVQAFFAEIFPRAGVAISIILVAVILTAIFIPEKHKEGWAIAFYSIGAIAFLFVLFNSFSAVGFFGTSWWGEWGGALIGALLLIGVIIAIAVSGPSKEKPFTPTTFEPWRRSPSS